MFRLTLVVPNVSFVPQLSMNLLPVGHVTDHNCCVGLMTNHVLFRTVEARVISAIVGAGHGGPSCFLNILGDTGGHGGPVRVGRGVGLTVATLVGMLPARHRPTFGGCCGWV
jgi:hypothetical protein